MSAQKYLAPAWFSDQVISYWRENPAHTRRWLTEHGNAKHKPVQGYKLRVGPSGVSFAMSYRTAAGRRMTYTLPARLLMADELAAVPAEARTQVSEAIVLRAEALRLAGLIAAGGDPAGLKAADKTKVRRAAGATLSGFLWARGWLEYSR